MSTRRYPRRASAARASSAIGAQFAAENGRENPAPESTSAPHGTGKRPVKSNSLRPRKKQKTEKTVALETDHSLEVPDDVEYQPNSGAEDDNHSEEFEALASLSEGDEDSRSNTSSENNDISTAKSRHSKGTKPYNKTKQTGAKSKFRKQKQNKDVNSDSGTVIEQHVIMLNKFFSEFDLHGNQRFTVADLRRVADDYGMDLTPEEAANMMRFWDLTGTNTISRDAFTQLAIDSKFVSAHNS